jgi:phosphatidylglycerol---prolipoprotein diacylglyceryl transferase
MFIEGINPVVFTVGSLAVRWYGLACAASLLAGFYYLRKNGLQQGFSEDDLFTVILLAVLGLVVRARAVFVITNWQTYAGNLVEILRITTAAWLFTAGFSAGRLPPGSTAG